MAALSRRALAARRRADAPTCSPRGVIFTGSIRARCRRAPPGRSANSRPRSSRASTSRIMATGRSGSSRIFGTEPGAYGIGLTQELDEDSSLTRHELGERYLAAASHAYCGAQGEGIATQAFNERVATADAFIHVQDQDEQDILDADAMIDHEGGFAAAAQMLGNDAPVYHVETARPGAIKVRPLAQEIARVVRARASNPR